MTKSGTRWGHSPTLPPPRPPIVRPNHVAEFQAACKARVEKARAARGRP